MKTKAASAWIWLAVLLLAAATALLLPVRQRQRELLASAIGQARELETVRAEIERARLELPPTAEVRQLRLENAALPKLRNEVRQLRERREQQARETLQQLANARERLLSEKQELNDLQTRAVCIKNLEEIDSAKHQWAAVNQESSGARVMMDQLAGFFPNGTVPVCAAGGHYSVNRIGAPPVCSVSGHALP